MSTTPKLTKRDSVTLLAPITISVPDHDAQLGVAVETPDFTKMNEEQFDITMRKALLDAGEANAKCGLVLYNIILPGLEHAENQFAQGKIIHGCKGKEEYIQSLDLKPATVRKWKQRAKELKERLTKGEQPLLPGETEARKHKKKNASSEAEAEYRARKAGQPVSTPAPNVTPTSATKPITKIEDGTLLQFDEYVADGVTKDFVYEVRRMNVNNRPWLAKKTTDRDGFDQTWDVCLKKRDDIAPVSGNVTPTVTPLVNGQQVSIGIYIGDPDKGTEQKVTVQGRISLPEGDNSFYRIRTFKECHGKRYADIKFELIGDMPKPQKPKPVTVTKKKRVAKVTKPTKSHVLSDSNDSTLAIKWTYCGKIITATEEGGRYTLLKQVHEEGKSWHYEKTDKKVKVVDWGKTPTCKTCANHQDYRDAMTLGRYKKQQKQRSNRAADNATKCQARELGVTEHPCIDIPCTQCADALAMEYTHNCEVCGGFTSRHRCESYQQWKSDLEKRIAQPVTFPAERSTNTANYIGSKKEGTNA